MTPKRRRNTCRVCGARWPWVYVSARGLCPWHSKQRMWDNAQQIHEHRGPAFERWREAMARSVGGELVERDAGGELAA